MKHYSYIIVFKGGQRMKGFHKVNNILEVIAEIKQFFDKEVISMRIVEIKKDN